MRRAALLLFSCFCLVASAALAADKSRSFEQILASGELRAGVALFTPWTLKSDKGELVGSEIDLGKRLAEDMGLEASFSVYDWSELIGALEKGEIDIIIGGMAITPERALAVNFSQPYGSAGIGLATNTRLTADFDNLAQLDQSDVAIGVIAGTVAEDIAKLRFPMAAVKPFKTQNQAVKALREGLIHALVASEPTPGFLALSYPEKIDEPLSQPLLETREAFAVHRGQHDFVNFLNAWIVAREADGWLPSTRHYWFETLNWRAEAKAE